MPELMPVPMPEHMPEQIPGHMPEHMPEPMPAPMPEHMPRRHAPMCALPWIRMIEEEAGLGAPFYTAGTPKAADGD